MNAHASLAAVGPPDAPRWQVGVRRLVVFRALMLGDMLCAVPALRALRAGFPKARLTLVGLPWAADLARRLACVDDFIALPGFPGLPEVPCSVQALPTFLADVQARAFDLAVQLHGSGGLVNNLVGLFGAHRMAGFHEAGAWVPPADAAHFVPWPREGHEIDRLLRLTDHLGAARCGQGLEFPLHEDDRRALDALLPAGMAGRRLAVVHAGSQLPSRRWPVERFAAVADALAEQGFAIVLTGGRDEAALAQRLAASMRTAPLDLVGRTTLWTLGALIERAERLVCNDTGVSHIAAALGCPSVVISSGADVARWAPLNAERHPVLWASTPCRPCAHRVCPYDNACARAVEVDAVVAALHGPHGRAEGPSAPLPGG